MPAILFSLGKKFTLELSIYFYANHRFFVFIAKTNENTFVTIPNYLAKENAYHTHFQVVASFSRMFVLLIRIDMDVNSIA